MINQFVKFEPYYIVAICNDNIFVDFIKNCLHNKNKNIIFLWKVIAKI